MMNLIADTTPAHRKGVLAQPVKPGDPAIVLLNPKNGEYYTLEGVGTRVWQLCDGQRTISAMAAVLSQEFDASAEAIEGDILALVKDLLDEGLVEVV